LSVDPLSTENSLHSYNSACLEEIKHTIDPVNQHFSSKYLYGCVVGKITKERNSESLDLWIKQLKVKKTQKKVTKLVTKHQVLASALAWHLSSWACPSSLAVRINVISLHNNMPILRYKLPNSITKMKQQIKILEVLQTVV
jgi:hypothetical protein